MPIRTPIIALIALAILAACGRKGDLQVPGDPDTPLLTPEGSFLNPPSPGADQPPAVRHPDAPDRPFLLDPLI